MMNIILYKYIYFYANVYKYISKVLQEKRYIIKQQVSKVRLKLEISNVKTGLKKYVVFLFFLKKKKESFYCFFSVNTECVIKHQRQLLELGVLEFRSCCCCLHCVNSLLFGWGLTYGFW